MASDDPTSGSPEPVAPHGGPLKAAGWLGPAADRLAQEVVSGLRGIVEKIARLPDAPQWTLIRRLASVDELRSLAESPPSGLVDALAPVLCPTLAWVKMFDDTLAARPKADRATWNASDPFKGALRALQNGWYEDALDNFRRAVDESPEDFVSLYGLAQLLYYWEGDPEAALAPLERAARYAVPVGARPWMKQFAAEALITRADLLVRLHEDYGLAHQHLSNAEEHVGATPDILLARARIAARTGNSAEVSRGVAKAIETSWFYAIQVALDPAFPATIADAVHEALDRTRSGLQDVASGRAGELRASIEQALADDDSGVPADRLADAKQRLRDLGDKLAGLLASDQASLLESLALGDRLADLAKTTERAVSGLAEQRRAVRAEIDRTAAAEEMSDLQAKREQLGLRRQRLTDAEAGAVERLATEEKEQAAKLKTETIQKAIRRVVRCVVPVFVVVLIYHFTEIHVSPSFSIGARGSGAAAGGPEAGGATRRKGPTVTTPGGAPPVGRSQLAPGGRGDAGPTAPMAPTAPGEPGVDTSRPEAAATSYHTSLDRWVWLLFVLYALGMGGLIANKEWAQYQTLLAALARKTESRREEILGELAAQRGPVEDELKRVTARLEELRGKV
jgi:hypothetical protein